MVGSISHRLLTALALMLTATALSGCLGEGGAPHLKPIPAAAQARLAKLGMTQESPILVRIFKQEAELEVWKQKDDGRFHHFKTYPICNYSGDLGPKLKEGDKQSPEGFYTVSPGRMNPNSNFHLSFNLGYPNAYDAAHGRTGAHLMVHGDCSSAGCYAMTDALIEEIYAIAREAFEGGQREFHVHAFPFRMTDEKLARYEGHRWYGFWQTLKDGYDAFEQTRVQPSVTVCEKRYVVNAEFYGDVVKPDPAKACPPHRKLDPQTILARLHSGEQQPAAQSRPVSRVASRADEAEAGEDEAGTAPRQATASRSEAHEVRSAQTASILAASVAPSREEESADESDQREAAEADEPAAETQSGSDLWVLPKDTPAAAKGDRDS
jgi:murein L,D-transpeptidase YafK